MCGIAGIISTPAYVEGAARPPVNAALDRMVRSLRHRGPDDEDVHQAQEGACEIALGHTRLAIIDLSPAGRQPMQDARTGNRLAYNGEIYNFKELRHTLDGDPLAWSSQSDTEVILRAYEKWRGDCVKHLRGMFAFALWDARERRLFLSRDRLGIKPLYYYAGEGFFLFASEVRALLESGLVPRRLDPLALWQYLAYQSTPTPRTLIQGVRSLAPGSWMTVDAGGQVDEGCYWDLLEQAAPAARRATHGESRRRVREILREAVALHLTSDVPVGVFLSGGIDSSALAALVREAGQTPRTFSVTFGESMYDESRYARAVAERFRTEHTGIRLTERTLLDQLPAALAAMDQPTGDGINSYVIARAVREKGIKVALSGLGGDEFFAGYPSFARLGRALKYQRVWGSTPGALRRLTARTLEVFGGSSIQVSKLAAMARSDGALAHTFPLTRQVLSAPQRRALMDETWGQRFETSPDPYVTLLEARYADDASAGTLAKISYAEGRTYMHDVLLRDTDQMSMAHALEVRVPLLDHVLVEYLMGLPDEHKRANGTPKRRLVESLAGLLPDEIVRRPKQGFTFPFEPWMRGGLRQFCEARLAPERIGSRGFFRPDSAMQLWQSFLAGRREVSWSRLWILVVLEEWLEQNGVTCAA